MTLSASTCPWILELWLGNPIERLLQLVKDHRLAITPDVTLLARSMITIEGTLSACAPDVHLLRILSVHMSNLLIRELDAKHLLKHKARQDILPWISHSIFAELSDFSNITKNGQAQINFQLSDGEHFRRDLYSIANRILLTIRCCPVLSEPDSPVIFTVSPVGSDFRGSALLDIVCLYFYC